MSQNMVESGRPHIVILLSVPSWINKAARVEVRSCAPPPHTHTHTRIYVILMDFPRKELFRERTSVLRHTYIVSLITLYHKFSREEIWRKAKCRIGILDTWWHVVWYTYIYIYTNVSEQPVVSIFKYTFLTIPAMRTSTVVKIFYTHIHTHTHTYRIYI
jgi:hypothetical protein